MKSAFDKIAAGLTDAIQFAETRQRTIRELREAYDSVLAERIPDEIRALVERLK